MASTPAHSLEGKELAKGWKVLKKITRKPISTGGKFSVGYRVVSSRRKIHSHKPRFLRMIWVN